MDSALCLPRINSPEMSLNRSEFLESGNLASLNGCARNRIQLGVIGICREAVLVSAIRPAEPTRRPGLSSRANADGILKFGQLARLKNSNRRWMLCRFVFQTTFWRAVLNVFSPGPVNL